MLVPLPFPPKLRTLTWLSGTLYLLIAGVMAVQPISTAHMAYATIDENSLFIHGGQVYTPLGYSSTTNQFFSLDLTQSWDVSEPAWKELKYPINFSAIWTPSGHSISVAPDGRSFTMWVLGQLTANYSIHEDSWSPSIDAATRATLSNTGMKATTDPTTGHVHIPGSGTNYSMTIYDFSNGRITYVPLIPAMGTAQRDYAFAWCQPRKTFLIFLSSDYSPIDPFYEYSPSTGQWSKVVTYGIIPTGRYRACMVSAYNGTKMLLFGGDTVYTPSLATLSILDIKSMTWTTAKDAPQARGGMACSVAGDSFIVWGGYQQIRSGSIGVTSEPLVYDMIRANWTRKYQPRIVPTPSPSITATTTPKGDSDAEVNGAAIGGGVVGGLVIFAAVAFLVIRRHRFRQDQQHNNPKDFEAVFQHDLALLSMENIYTRQALDKYPQVKPDQYRDVPNSPQYIAKNQPQGVIHSKVPSSPPPPIPPRPDLSSVTSTYPQDYIQQLEHQIAVNQEQLAIQNDNPQFDPTNTRFHSTPLRGPQSSGEIAVATSSMDIEDQIEALQAEVRRLQAMRKTE